MRKPHRGDGARHRLAERIAALHRGLRRQVGVDVDRQHRLGVAEMGQRNADGVVDLGGRGEGRVEILPVELAHQLEGDLARDLPVEFAAGELAGRLAADMDREGRRGGVEELLGVVVGEDDPEVGLERAQPLADVGRDLPHLRDHRLVLGVRQGEELGRMRQHCAADHGRLHGGSLDRPNVPPKSPDQQATASLPVGALHSAAEEAITLRASSILPVLPRSAQAHSSEEPPWSTCR